MHTATTKVENSAQVSSSWLKFVHELTYSGKQLFSYIFVLNKRHHELACFLCSVLSPIFEDDIFNAFA